MFFTALTKMKKGSSGLTGAFERCRKKLRKAPLHLQHSPSPGAFSPKSGRPLPDAATDCRCDCEVIMAAGGSRALARIRCVRASEVRKEACSASGAVGGEPETALPGELQL